jgi:hypothetical protein
MPMTLSKPVRILARTQGGSLADASETRDFCCQGPRKETRLTSAQVIKSRLVETRICSAKALVYWTFDLALC